MLIPVLLFTTVACNEIDTAKDDKWQYVSIGQSRDNVVFLMGQPSSENSINLLGIDLNQLEWRSDLYSKTYQVNIAFDKVISKQFNQ